MGECEQRNIRVTLGKVTPGDGPEFAVTLMRAGVANGYTFPPAVLRASLPLWEGATAFVDHSLWGRSVQDVCGSFYDTGFDAGEKAIVGVFRPAGRAGEAVAAIARQIVEDRDNGLPVPNVGLSADMWLRYDGGQVVQEIAEVISVDVVFDPAAGGAFERVLNSVDNGQLAISKGGCQMGKELQSGAGQAGNLSPDGRGLPAQAASTRASEELLRAQCASMLNSALAATDLPGPFVEHVRAQFADRAFTPADLDAAIEAQRQIWARLGEHGVVRGLGRVEMQDGMDRLRMATEHLFGLPVQGDFERLSGIRELYLLLTGDHDFRGGFYPDRVQFANANTSTMAELVRNAMNKVVVAQYEKLGQAGYLWWKKIVHEEDFTSLQQVSWITVGGFGDLPTVNEGAAYTELTWDDARETPTWAKKGGYIGLTLEMLDRDDSQKVKELPGILATSAIRTVSKLVAEIFSTANSTGSPTGYGPTLSDGGACFNSTAVGTGAGHANLGSTALSASQWDTVLQLVFKQPELNSSKRLGVKPRFLLVPIELEKTALKIFLSEGEPGTADNDANVRRGSAEDVVVVPEWTDANDWAAVADPAIAPGIGIAYRFGREPEIFIAGDPLVGSMFTNDEMRLKVRFLVAVHVVNWRPVYFSHV
jgi:hypothetical protein